jgi:hypothetical protein
MLLSLTNIIHIINFNHLPQFVISNIYCRALLHLGLYCLFFVWRIYFESSDVYTVWYLSSSTVLKLYDGNGKSSVCIGGQVAQSVAHRSVLLRMKIIGFSNPTASSLVDRNECISWPRVGFWVCWARNMHIKHYSTWDRTTCIHV